MNDPVPYNLEVEQLLIGVALAHEKVIDRVPKLRGYHFYDPLHARLYECMLTLSADEKPIRPATMMTFFKEDEGLKAVGGVPYLTKLSAEADFPNHIGAYAETIVDLWRRRDLLAQLNKSKQQLLDVEVGGSFFDISDDLVTAVTASDLSDPGDRFIHVSDLAERVADGIEEAYKDPDSVRGIVTGIDSLDQNLNGLQRGQLIILAGRPGMGKSTMASAMSLGVAHNNNREVAVALYSLEMSSDEWGLRIVSDTSSSSGDPIEYTRARSGKVTPEEMLRVFDAVPSLEGVPLYIDDGGGRTLASMRASILRLKRKLAKQDISLGVVFVDQLTHVASGNRYAGNKVNELGEITAGLKAVAKQLDVCVVLVHQLNRGVENRDNKRPNLADLRDSGNIEQDADVALFVYREAYYIQRSRPDDMASPEYDAWQHKVDLFQNELELIISKQRMGPTCSLNLYCDITTGTVRDGRPLRYQSDIWEAHNG